MTESFLKIVLQLIILLLVIVWGLQLYSLHMFIERTIEKNKVYDQYKGVPQ